MFIWLLYGLGAAAFVLVANIGLGKLGDAIEGWLYFVVMGLVLGLPCFVVAFFISDVYDYSRVVCVTAIISGAFVGYLGAMIASGAMSSDEEAGCVAIPFLILMGAAIGVGVGLIADFGFYSPNQFDNWFYNGRVKPNIWDFFWWVYAAGAAIGVIGLIVSYYIRENRSS